MNRLALIALPALVLCAPALLPAPALAQDYDVYDHALDHGGVALDHDHGVVEPDPASVERDQARSLVPTVRPRTSDANRAIVETAYADLARGDVEAVLRILDPHVMWTDAEGFPYAGTHVGPGTVAREVFARIGAEWDHFDIVPREFVASGSRVVVLGEYRGTYAATGRSVRAPFAHVWQVQDGAVVSFRQFTDGPPWQRVVTP